MPQRRAFRFEPLWWLDADTRAVEAFSALLAWIYAAVLLWPGDLFGQLSSYSVMAAIMAEGKWGAMFVFQGLLQSAAMCGNVRLLRYPSAIIAFFLWFFIGACFWFANPQVVAAYFFFLIAAFMGWVISKGPPDGDR